MSSLSHDDIDILVSIGHDITQNIVCLVVEAIMYTFFFVLVVIAGRIQFQKGSKPSITMFGVILIMFLLDTATCILDVSNAIREITFTLTSTSSLSLSDGSELTISIPYFIIDLLFAYMFCFGDVIIVWRASVFWCYGKERLMMILPVLTLISTFVIAGVTSFCVAREISEDAPDSLVIPPLCDRPNRRYTTWIYRREIGKYLNESNKKTRTEKVMLLVVESGVIYFLLLLELVINGIPKVAKAESANYTFLFADVIWSYMMNHLLGIYPALMVILVNSELSCLEESFRSIHIETTQMDSIRFGSTTSHTTEDTAPYGIEINVPKTDEAAGIVFGHTATFSDVYEGREGDSYSIV